MKILVLGASGFLGGKVYHRLQENPRFQVKGTYLRICNNIGLRQLNIKNGNDVDLLFGEHRPDAVVWCLLDQKDEKALSEVGLHNVIRNIAKTTRFIYISTDAVFIEGKGNYSEDVPVKLWSSCSPLAGYVNGKIQGEEIVRGHQNHVIIRTGPLYGQDIHGKWDKRTSRLIALLSNNQAVYRSSNLLRTFTCVDDLAELILEVIENDYTGFVHAGPENIESYYSFNRKMAEKLGLNFNLLFEDLVSSEDTQLIPLDTSMNTTMCRTRFKTRFRKV